MTTVSHQSTLADYEFDPSMPWSEAGAHATVFKAKVVATKAEVAMKRPRWGREETDMRDGVIKETEVWRKLSHDNVLKFLHLVLDGHMLYLVFPFASNGTVISWLKKNPEADRLRVVIEVAEGLAYLHGNGIIHGDMKAGNVLIDSSGVAKVADYGLYQFRGRSQSLAASEIIRLRHLSPESLMGAYAIALTESSDTYAFGMTIYEILSGEVPFYNIPELARIIQAVCAGERPPKEPKSSSTGQSYAIAWVVAERCWAESLDERISMEKAVQVLKPEEVSGQESVLPATQVVIKPAETEVLGWANTTATLMSSLLATITFGYSKRLFKT